MFEGDKLVIFVIFIMVSSLTGAKVLRQGGREVGSSKGGLLLHSYRLLKRMPENPVYSYSRLWYAFISSDHHMSLYHSIK